MAGKHMHEAAPSSIFKAGGRREHSGGTVTTKTTDDGEAAEGVPWLTGWGGGMVLRDFHRFHSGQC